MDLNPSDILFPRYPWHRVGDDVDGVPAADQFHPLRQGLALRPTLERVEIGQEVTDPKGPRIWRGHGA